MYNKIMDYGDVNEVVIPPYKDIRGKRFGFVRFFWVEDIWVMTAKLENIIIVGKKIYANIPKYQRSKGVLMRGEEEKKRENEIHIPLRGGLNKRDTGTERVINRNKGNGARKRYEKRSYI